MIGYIPCSEITKDGRMSLKWMVILGLMRLSWEIGDDDIYAMVKDHEFILSNDRLQISPLDPIIGRPTNDISNGQLNIFIMAEAKELNLLINDL